MLKQTSKSFRKVFILEFTRELLRNTEKYKKLTIKKEVKKVLKEAPETKTEKKSPEKELKKRVHEKIKEEKRRVSKLKKDEPHKGIKNLRKEFKKEPRPVKTSVREPRSFPAPLRIAEPLLPETVRYIRPAPIRKEIDLGKLNALINDPFVKIIECFGPDQKIFVSGRMGRKRTPIILTKEEIDGVIKNFSENSKIPVHEGVLNIAFGRLYLSTIISEVTSPRFVIRKMPVAGSYRR